MQQGQADQAGPEERGQASGQDQVSSPIYFDGGGVRVERYDTGDGHPWYDDRLVAFLLQHAADAVAAIDAPLTLPAAHAATSVSERKKRLMVSVYNGDVDASQAARRVSVA